MSFFEKFAVKKPNCVKCGLHKKCITPRMEETGKGQKEILIIGEAPGEQEDKLKTQFIGKAGKELRKYLVGQGINLDRDCWKINAVNCRPINEKGGNATPTNIHVNACRPYVESIIKKLKPKKIILLGGVSLDSFFSDRIKGYSIGKMEGLKFWDSKYKAWVFPLYHPSYLMRNEKDKALHATFKRDLRQAINHDNAPLKKKWNKVRKLVVFDEVIANLKKLLKSKQTIAVDYETTGLDIFKKGHKIVSIGYATKNEAVAFPAEHHHWSKKEQKVIMSLWRKVLKKPKIKKIVHNINTEYPWSKQVIGQRMNKCIHDTLLGAHVLDNRGGIGALKFQAFMRWGIEEYDALSRKYIKTNPKTGFNDMLKMPLDALLEYNALDVLYTYELYIEQLQEFVGDEFEAYRFFHDGATVLCDMHLNGINVNEEYYLKQREELVKERDTELDILMDMKEIREFSRKYGHDFNMDSPHDLQKMLYKIMGLKPTKMTKTGYSVDAEVLGKIDVPLTQQVIKVRKINKMISTYVDGYLKHVHEGMMHSEFLLNTARSFRSSSKKPNFQNAPKRDKKAKKIVRSGMVPSPGNVLVEADFAGAEIATSCFYHNDPTFVEYQTNPEGGDMHRDAAGDIWMAKGLISKKVRQAIKGGWTFSQFYGSYYVSCAKQMWEEMLDLKLTNDITIREHIKDKFILDKIGTVYKKLPLSVYKNFEEHVRRFEDKFWNTWFPVYTKWKNDVYYKYLETGYVETFFGFRFKGYMDKKKCTNYPIQGTSFHLLLYTLIEVSKEIKRRGLKTRLIGQIHDSIIADAPPEELDDLKDIIGTIVRGLHKKFAWMSVPMDVDMEISDTYENGGNFANMTEVTI